MLEQPDAEERSGFAIVSLKLALSRETRASLEAVRAAQESAQRRARQQTVQAWLWVALLVGAVALGAVVSRPRLAHWRQSRAHGAQLGQMPAPTSARTSLAPSPLVRQVSAAPAATAVATPTALAIRQPEPSVPAAAAPIPLQAKANGRSAPAEGCDISTRRGLWRRSPEACARAFAADPKNASLALAVAQAEHAHAHLDEAAQWAKRALALDPNAAEAYIIIARAETENGRDEDARAAYQRYLEVAPRGWHKAEARGALRQTSSTPR